MQFVSKGYSLNEMSNSVSKKKKETRNVSKGHECPRLKNKRKLLTPDADGDGRTEGRKGVPLYALFTILRMTGA